MKILRLRRLRKKGMSSSVKRKTEEQRRVRNLLNRSLPLKITICVATFLLAVMSITMFERYQNLGVTVGFNADVDYYNSFEFKYEDPEKTNRIRIDAVSTIPDIFRFEENELERDLSVIATHVKQWLIDRKAMEDVTPPVSEDEFDDLREKYEKLIKRDVPGLSEEDISVITGLEKPIEGMAKITSIIEGLFNEKFTVSSVAVPANGLDVQPKQFSAIEAKITLAVKEACQDVTENEKQKLLKIPFFFVNQRNVNQLYMYDDLKTKGLIQAAVEKSIKPEYKTVTRGSTIVGRGNRIRREHVVQLMENLQRSDESKLRGEMVSYYLGVAAVVAILFILFGIYLRFYQSGTFSSNARLAVIGMIIVLTLIFSKLFICLRFYNPFFFVHPIFDYPVFVPFAAILASLMFGMNLALVMSFVLGALVGVIFDFSLSHGLLALTSSITAAYFSAGVRRRSDLVKISLMIGCASSIVVLAVSMAKNMGVALTQLWQCLGGFSFALLGAGLATVSLPIFEYVFRITTNISLMELTDTKHQLLRRLIMETPGTYHHSLVVGNLAEAAAESVGANALLARVSSYYHDIGKLKKPGYFSENEKQTKSKHDSLIPSMSSLIIVSHAKDGVDLAIKHKLNKEIIDIIKQHHGTSLVYFFYKRAIELGNEGEPVDQSDFRYPGPKPQSKEAAIIMLADSVEAASRSLDRVSSSKLSSLVRDIITSKFSDGQLDECDLTLKDLHKIEDTFVHILMGSLHQRVKYPKEGEKTLPSNGELEETESDEAAEVKTS